MARQGRRHPGPIITAQDPWLPAGEHGGPRQVLSERQRMRLMAVASIVRFRKGERIYAAGAPAKAAYTLISGIATSYVDGVGRITGFLYPGDLFGLSEGGRYVNTAVATTAVTAYSLPLANVRRFLLDDPELDVEVIVKLCHELRLAQRHALLLSQRHAVSRLAMFLDQQEHLQAVRGERSFEIYLPMSRSAIAGYVGLSLATLSRAFATLTADGVIESRDLRHVRILDRAALQALLAAPPLHRRQGDGADRTELEKDVLND
ncbi:Crp/Fnr family transcriptional regulator [Reyranella sp.]|jgi:CRP/FNR family transcriptional regulator|uniref:Crp/Fnr family transcriptional regulator n=1 Tax=Reyranella sp. TaxID=1929291 RepID=UPI002F927094